MKEYNEPEMVLIELEEIKCTSQLISGEIDDETGFGPIHW